MKLFLNGDVREIADAADVATLITMLGLPAPAMLVEHNGEALRRDEWPTRQIAEGDRIEIVRIVAGG